MAQLNRTDYDTKFVQNSGVAAVFKDNTTEDIGADDIREFAEAQKDSLFFLLEDAYKSFAVTAAGTDTYTATPSPPITSYVTGSKYYVNFTNTNTGASTLNLAGLGAKSIKNNAGADVAAGDLDGLMHLYYDGTNFQVIGGSGGGGGGSPSLSDVTDLTGNHDIGGAHNFTLGGGSSDPFNSFLVQTDNGGSGGSINIGGSEFTIYANVVDIRLDGDAAVNIGDNATEINIGTGLIFPDITIGSASTDTTVEGTVNGGSILIFMGLWNFAGNSGNFPSVDKGRFYVAEDDHGSPGDADYVAAGTWFVSMVDSATTYSHFRFK